MEVKQTDETLPDIHVIGRAIVLIMVNPVYVGHFTNELHVSSVYDHTQHHTTVYVSSSHRSSYSTPCLKEL